MKERGKDARFEDIRERFESGDALNRYDIEYLVEGVESARAEAEYEVRSRIAAATFSRDRYGYIPCERCGHDAGMDAVVPFEVWRQITPHPEYPDSGFLCVWCMDEVCAERGVRGPVDVCLYFTGEVLRSQAYQGEEP